MLCSHVTENFPFQRMREIVFLCIENGHSLERIELQVEILWNRVPAVINGD